VTATPLMERRHTVPDDHAPRTLHHQPRDPDRSVQISPEVTAVKVPRQVAEDLASACTLAMDGHQWAGENIISARTILTGPGGAPVINTLAGLLCRTDAATARRAAAGVLAALGRPFFSINESGRLWIGAEATLAKDPSSFGGTGHQGLHIDAPNVERVPDFTSLLMLRSDPAGGGQSLIGDLQSALADLAPADRAELSEVAYFEGSAEGLHGTGAPRMPFPVVDTAGTGRPWIRWGNKMTGDPRNNGHADVLERFAEALDGHTRMLGLDRGALLILDQQRTAHGRMALGDQTGLPDGTRRLINQAKVSYDPAAPAHCPARFAGGRHA
jgi:hypothetical protein